jgi:4-hydroxythreonine-4-phosphate dehydrogenase
MGDEGVPVRRRTKPRIGVLPGDPNGVGPELVARLVGKLNAGTPAGILVIGDRHVVSAGASVAGSDLALPDLAGAPHPAESQVPSLYPLESIDADAVTPGQASAAAGRSILSQLDAAVDLAVAGVIDGICYAPLNKAAMHLAGLSESDEMQYVAARLGVRGSARELNAVDGLWTTRITSHVALKDVAGLIDGARIVDAIRLLHDTIADTGVAAPRIAVAALNPHAGDNGNFGREEIDVIAPAVTKARREGFDVIGPWSPDSVFLLGKDGRVDGIVAMYHDQS